MNQPDAKFGLVICNDLGIVLNHRLHILREAVRRGWTFHIIGAGDAAIVAGEPGLSVGKVTVYRFSFRLFGDSLLFLRVLWFLARRRPRLVHSISLKPNLYGGLAVRVANWLPGRRIRLVGMSPGLGRLFEQTTSLKSKLRRVLVFGGLRAAFAPASTMVVFENESDSATWIANRLVPSARAHVVQGAGISLTEFSASQAAKDGRMSVVLASRLLRQKGIADFLDAAMLLRARDIDVEMVLAGAIETEDPDGFSAELILNHPAIRYVGHCSDMPGLLAGAHVVCLPTRYMEGIPRILLEGAASGCALIVTDLPGCRLIVEHGVNGYVLAARDGLAEDMADAIGELAADRTKLARFRAASAAKAQTGGFSSSEIADAYANLFEGAA